MTLRSLASEVAEGYCGGQGGANAFQIWPERLRLDIVNYWQGGRMQERFTICSVPGSWLKVDEFSRGSGDEERCSWSPML